MKRALALLMALCLLTAALPAALGEGDAVTKTVELQKDGLTILRCKTSGEEQTMKFKEDYPAFESEDATLAEYLTQTITDPLLALRRTSPIVADASVYTAETKDYIRMSFAASMDFPGILSLEASVGNRAADKSVNETLFFYRIINLYQRSELSVYDLFTEPRDAVDSAVREAVFAQKDALGLTVVTDASQVPAPNSYFLSTAAFRCLFAAGAVAAKATVVDIPWDQLALTRSEVLLNNTPIAQAATAEQGADEPTALTDPNEIIAALTANDWTTEGSTLRFDQNGGVSDPTGSDPLFVTYAVRDGKLYLSSAEREDQGATVWREGAGLTVDFEPETSDYDSLILTPAQTTGTKQTVAEPTPIPAATPAPASAAPVETPTPMPVTGTDAEIVDFLTQGLWKQLGTDGTTYYQMTPDGKLLTVNVSPYTVTDGTINSDSISGEVTLGGNTFTVTQADGAQVGFVLNRNATAIPGEEFVTPTPTPTPSPSPTPSPTPTASPTPSPTPVPTPTLSPYEQAAQTAPTLAALGDATFARRQTLKVYSAPDEASFRDAKAQVTTDETVSIFGVTGNWVLVGYRIGNGSRGRIGYVADTTLNNPAGVAQLGLVSIELTLTKDASATDDPLNGKTKLFGITKGTTVKLLAFMGADWAYVETTYKGKVCRAFIPRASLMSE